MAKILIVDDSRTSRRILRNILTDAGHEVLGEAENGEIAVEKATTLNPDIITLDITMPIMDGLEALKIIKKDNQVVKVVMISASGQKNKMMEAISMGAVEFLLKPFEEDEIINVMSTLSK